MLHLTCVQLIYYCLIAPLKQSAKDNNFVTNKVFKSKK